MAGYRHSLTEGIRRGLHAAPRQVETVAAQLADGWRPAAGAAGSPTSLRRAGGDPAALAAELDDGQRRGRRGCRRAAGLAAAASTCPRRPGTPDGVGEERYRRGVRRWTGADLDLAEAYDWGWSQYRQIRPRCRPRLPRCCPARRRAEAMRYLDEHGEAVEGVEQIRERLQQLMDEAMDSLSGTHFDLAGPIKVVEARIAPPGSAAAPYYTGPSQDFSRPGRTWLPTLGKTTFPIWNLVSTWYHEGVPGHHLQIAQWTYLSPGGCRSTRPAWAGSAPARRLGAVRRAADGRARASCARPAPGWATWTRS